MHALILASLIGVRSLTVPVVSWSFDARPLEGGEVAIECTATVQNGWHIYATRLESDLGPIPTTIRLLPSDAYVPVGEWTEPEAEEVFDPNFEMLVRYHSGTPVFVRHVRPCGHGDPIIKGEVEFMVCNDVTCLPPEVVPFTLDLTAR